MQAIIRLGGKQYLVRENDTISVANIKERSEKDVQPEVLALFNEDSIQIGSPVLEKAVVSANIVKDIKGPKIHVYKFKSKSNYRRKIGYRDKKTIIRINSISYEK